MAAQKKSAAQDPAPAVDPAEAGVLAPTQDGPSDASTEDDALVIAPQPDPPAKCEHCVAERPCSPECYRAAGYETTDDEFLRQFGEPLRLASLPGERELPVHGEYRVKHGAVKNHEREHVVGDALVLPRHEAAQLLALGIIERM